MHGWSIQMQQHPCLGVQLFRVSSSDNTMSFLTGANTWDLNINIQKIYIVASKISPLAP
jgi:hypothetical protein